MDSSFGKNAANRVEESYGDAKNLSLRHPQAALGFLYGLRSTAFTDEPDTAAWLLDLLAKLGREEDAYDAVALVVPDWNAPLPPGDEGLTDEAAPIDIESEVTPTWGDAEQLELPQVADGAFAELPSVALRHDLVPAEL